MAKTISGRRSVPGEAPTHYSLMGTSQEFGRVVAHTPVAKYMQYSPLMDHETPTAGGHSLSHEAELVLRSGGREVVLGSRDNDGRIIEDLINAKLAELGAPLTRSAKFGDAVSGVLPFFKNGGNERAIPEDLQAWLRFAPPRQQGQHVLVPVSFGREKGFFSITPAALPPDMTLDPKDIIAALAPERAA